MSDISDRAPWTEKENDAIVADYLEMLELELTGQAFNKAAHNRAIQKLTGRSKGSVEFKHCNISALMREFGLPLIDGYKPRSNAQDALRDTIQHHIAQRASIASTVHTVGDSPVEALAESLVSSTEEVSPPTKEKSDRVYERPIRSPIVPLLGFDYAARDAANRSLGLRGEELILAVEHKRLWEAGRRTLAEKLEHVSASQGDGLGYDIHSYEDSGADRLIEVKTTKFGVHTPFFVSANEERVSGEKPAAYQLFRVFRFGPSPKFFVLHGHLSLACELTPISYRAEAS
jgi:Domain of unknown function (DUF3883)